MTNNKESGMETVNVAEAKSKFSDLISRAASGERILIKRRERPVAVLIGAAELEQLERLTRAAHRLALELGQEAAILEKIEKNELHPAMAAFGLWREERDLATLADEISIGRYRASERPASDL